MQLYTLDPAIGGGFYTFLNALKAPFLLSQYVSPLFFKFYCMCIVALHVCVCVKCVECPQRPEEGARFHWSGVMDDCERHVGSGS